jgi:hypothetical protein
LGICLNWGPSLNTRLSKALRQDTPNDVGTLWTMWRLGRRARCALMAWPGEWELRILIDGEITLAERCPRGPEAFAFAEVWRRRMLEDRWRQIVPNAERGNVLPAEDRSDREAK